MRKKFNIITFGSATKDIFFVLPKNSHSVKNKELRFPLGAKAYVEEIRPFSGGGGTNSAVGFAKQGFKTACIAKIGNDGYGDFIKKDLQENGVYTKFVSKNKKLATALSVILSSGKERNILVHHGATKNLKESDVPWSKIKTEVFYIAPLPNNQLLFHIVKNAVAQKSMIIFNPGKYQIGLGIKKLKRVLKETSILMLNDEEAQALTGEKDIKKTLRILKEEVKGIVVITKGENGSIAIDEKGIWEADTPPVPVTEKTGAGDAFGTGFVSEYLRSGDMKKALQYGTANAISCFGKMGTKNGLLRKNRWGKARKAKVKLLRSKKTKAEINGISKAKKTKRKTLKSSSLKKQKPKSSG